MGLTRLVEPRTLIKVAPLLPPVRLIKNATERPAPNKLPIMFGAPSATEPPPRASELSDGKDVSISDVGVDGVVESGVVGLGVVGVAGVLGRHLGGQGGWQITCAEAS